MSDDEKGLKILEQLFNQSKKIIKKKGSIKFIFNDDYDTDTESENKK